MGVRCEVREGVGWIIFDQPARLNAVDPPMLVAAREAVDRYAADPAVRCIVITGEGRGFCSGAVLSADGAIVDTLYTGGELVRSVLASPTPVVACVNGVAGGIGVSIAVACDYVVAAESAVFVLAFSRIGLLPDGGSTALIAASIGRTRAMRLALTGEKLDAVTAAQWGLVSETVSDTAYEDRCAAVVAELAAKAPQATAETKAAINAASADVAAAMAIEEPAQVRLAHTADFAEGARAFVEKRPPRFTGE